MKVKELLGKMSMVSDLKTVEFYTRSQFNGSMNLKQIDTNGVWDNRTVNSFVIKNRRMIIYLKPIDE